MVEAAKQLENLPEDDRSKSSVQSTLIRIYATCRGHMKWLERCDKLKEKGAYGEDIEIFPAHHWITGKKFAHYPSSTSWIPRNASHDFENHDSGHSTPSRPVDTAFQILKAAAYADLVGMNRDGPQDSKEIVRKKLYERNCITRISFHTRGRGDLGKAVDTDAPAV